LKGWPFLCRAICQELAGSTVSLKEIKKARAERRKQVKAGLSTHAVVVEQFIAVQQDETPFPPSGCRHQRSGGDRTRESHHRAGLSEESMMSYLKTVRLLR
jgi:hypothetical protein